MRLVSPVVVMPSKRTWALLTVTWVSIAAVTAVACQAPSAEHGGTDGGSARNEARQTTDSNSPVGGPAGSMQVGAAPHSARAIWSFNGYCGDGTDVDCPDYDDCPVIAGGVAASDCTAPFARCLTKSGAAGVADRIFVCEALASAVWDLNRLCPFDDCTAFDGGACPAFDGGVAGQTCDAPLERCLSGQKVFVCQPPGVTSYMFNGYCDAGLGTAPCAPLPACEVDGGVAGAPCTTPLDRCLSNGRKAFVCAQR
jgi:hypothetical protein